MPFFTTSRLRIRRQAWFPFFCLALCLLSGAPPAVAESGTSAFCPANLEQSSPLPTENNCGHNSDSSDPGAAPQGLLPRTTLGNPVSLVTGNKIQRETDYAVAGARLGFRRFYSSANADQNIGLGQGWSHTYAVRLFSRVDGGREIVDSTGRQLVFELASTSSDGRRIYRSGRVSDGYLQESDKRRRWHLADGRTLSFHGQYLVELNWPGHQQLSLFYRDERLASVTDETGRKLRFEYTPGQVGLARYEQTPFQSQAGHLAALVLPDGSRIEYDYDGRKNLTRKRFTDGTARIYHYENPIWPSHLTGLSNRLGHRFATWAFDDSGRATLSEHAGGVEQVTLSYELPENVGDDGMTLVTNSLGAESRYHWRRDPDSGASQMLSSTGPGCASCPPTGLSYRYSPSGQLLAVTHTNGGSREFGYDDVGRLSTITDVLTGGERRWVERREYTDGGFRPTRIVRPSINPDGERIVETVLSEQGLVTSVIESGFAPTSEGTRFLPIERSTSLVHEAGRLVAIDGPRTDVDDITRFQWDEQARLKSIQPPVGPMMQFDRFDANGRFTEFRIGNQSPFHMSYNMHGKVDEIRQRALRYRFQHDAEGQLISVTDPDGRTTSIEHDAAGRAKRFTDEAGLATRLAYDGESRVSEQALMGLDGSLLKSLSYVFDVQGRLESSAQSQRRSSPDRIVNSERYYEYDESGRLTSVQEADSEALASLSVDQSTRSARIERSDGSKIAFEFDAVGQDIAFTDSRENRSHFLKDDFGRVVRHTHPDTGTNEYLYDAAGNRVARLQDDGTTTRYQWDAAGRLLVRETGDGITTRTYGSDHGRLIQTNNPTTTERFYYDDEHQLIRHVREIDGFSFSTGYRYDKRGRISTKTLPDGQELKYHYHASGDSRGRLRAITRSRLFGLSEEVLVGEIDTDARDGSTGYVSSGGIRTTTRFSPAGDIQSLAISQGLKLDYRFDDAGRIIGIDENGLTQQFRYSSNRLATASTLIGNFSYQYDTAGNRTTRSASLATGDTMHDYSDYPPVGEGNRLLESTDVLSGIQTSYRYDIHGSPIAAGDLRYEYNADGRPVKVWRDDVLIASYNYNSFGERIRKVRYSAQGKPTVTYFLYDGHTLTAEADASGAITEQYIYLDGYRAVAKLEGRAAYAIHGDHVGTPRLMTDADGAPVWQASYTPFGQAIISFTRRSLPLRFPGQYADEETGTYYNYLRDYDPSNGRYLTSDPIGLKGGSNTYAYAQANPLAAIDPLGLFPYFGNDDPDEQSSSADKPEAGSTFSDGVRTFGYFAVQFGEQYVGYARGFLNAAGETVLFAVDVLQYSADHGPLGHAIDYIFEDPPAWLPSYERGRETTDQIVDVAKAIKDDPSLIWQAIKDPYVQAWAECRYGEALGRGAFEVGSLLLPAGLATRLTSLNRLGRVSTLADVLTVIKRSEALSPDEAAASVGRLIDEARTSGTVDELIEAARQTDTLDELVRSGRLTDDEIKELRDVPGVTGTLDNANFAQPVVRSNEAFSPDGQIKYSQLAGRPISSIDDLADAIRDGAVDISDIAIDFVDLDGTRLILNTRTSIALQRAGIPRSEWAGVRRTGQIAYVGPDGPVTFDQLAREQLKNNIKRALPGTIGWPETISR